MIKSIAFTALVLSASAFASPSEYKKPLSKSCLSTAVAAVNKHHKLAEGSVYAVRQLYTGEFAAVLLVGHSDETDATDYLVTVEKEGCKIKSITYTNEAGDVEDYTADEQSLVNELR
jgi:hypothetical protein